uniref:Uncharacterized protein n=1 Tax=Electrophorus electricus TaxID=8005 RepID=A0AAY5E840_ELEEL
MFLLPQDTQEFISTFHTEAPQKKSNLSNQDVSLQERVRAQLRAALFDIHDIFFAITMDERLALLAQDRELRAERKLREMVNSSPCFTLLKKSQKVTGLSEGSEFVIKPMFSFIIDNRQKYSGYVI